MARLFGDENFPLPAVIALRHLGHDVLTLQEAGHGGQAMPDDAVLALASQEQHAVLTLNRRHFIRLHGLQPTHAGVIVCTYDPDFSALAARIHAATQSEEHLAGRLLRVNRPSR